MFQFLGLLVFLEIIELNFIGLNKNTKKNIEIREGQENMKFMNAIDRDSISERTESKYKIEYSPGYLLEAEMIHMSDEEEKKDFNKDSEH